MLRKTPLELYSLRMRRRIVGLRWRGLSEESQDGRIGECPDALRCLPGTPSPTRRYLFFFTLRRALEAASGRARNFRVAATRRDSPSPSLTGLAQVTDFANLFSFLTIRIEAAGDRPTSSSMRFATVLIVLIIFLEYAELNEQVKQKGPDFVPERRVECHVEPALAILGTLSSQRGTAWARIHWR